MFDPSIGRWFQEDPILIEGGDPNMYRYCGNNPTNATDPTGLVAVLSYKTASIKVAKWGEIEIETRWDLSEATKQDGLIYQKVSVQYSVFKNGNEVGANAFFRNSVVAGSFNELWFPYIEIWTVAKGAQHSEQYEGAKKIAVQMRKQVREFDDTVTLFPPWTDTDDTSIYIIKLEAVFVEGTKEIPAGYTTRNASPAGSLPVRLSHDGNRPVAVGRLPVGPNVSPVVKREYQVTWDNTGATKVRDVSDPNKPIVVTQQMPFKP